MEPNHQRFKPEHSIRAFQPVHSASHPPGKISNKSQTA